MKPDFSAFLILCTLVITAPAFAADNGLAPEPARPADSLVDSIGVATHFNFYDSMYCTRGEQVQTLLGELGVRIIRDAIDPRQERLWEQYGIRIIALHDDPHVPWADALSLWKDQKPRIAAIEGPNEVNGGWAKLNKTYQGKGWPEGPRLFQEDLRRSLKNDPDLKDVPLIAVSTAYKGDGVALSPLTAFDYANTHSYPAGAMPSKSLDFRDPFLLLGKDATLPPLVATETGYHTCLGSDKVIAGNQPGLSHAAHRKYIPRLLAEYFNAGFRWTVLYEFGAGRPKKAEQEDPEAAFGLLMPDATPKPAYFALKDLIATLSESKWDVENRRWITPAAVAPRALAFALRDAPDTVHHTLLRHADGGFLLLLWNEVPSFDPKTKRDIANLEVPVRLVLGTPAESVTVTRLGPDAPPALRFADTREITLAVPDEVIVVEIKPKAPTPPAAIQPPAEVEIKTGPTSVTLSWPPSPDADAYWVSLNGRNLGQARRTPDDLIRFEMTGLLPATTYPFEIVASSRAGGVSPAARVAATTVDAFPDLVVQSLKIVPASSGDGDTADLVAVIANIGQAPTEAGVVIGAKFRVDGKTLCWSDALRGPLAPGQTAEVRPTGGFNGRTSLRLTPKPQTVVVLVDDANRIAESDEKNNTATVVAAPLSP